MRIALVLTAILAISTPMATAEAETSEPGSYIAYLVRGDYTQTTYCGLTYTTELRLRDLLTDSERVVTRLGNAACGGQAQYPRFSPDGTQLSWYTHGGNATQILDLQTGERRTLPRCEKAEWSPDGSKIACSTYFGNWTYQIFDSVTLESIYAPPNAREHTAYTFDWLDNDTLLAAGYDFTSHCLMPDGVNGSYDSALWRVDLTSGEFAPLMTPQCGTSLYQPQVSPDGGQYVISAGASLLIGSTDTGVVESVQWPSLGDGYDAPLQAVWSEAGDELIVITVAMDPTVMGGSRLRADRYNIASGRRAPLLLSDQESEWDVYDVSGADLPVADDDLPMIVGAPDRQPDSSGWYRSPVTVTWSAIDPDPSSGMTSTPSPTTIAVDGANQTAISDQACDGAGNCATGTFGPVSIDQAAPTVTVTGVTHGAEYTVGAVPEPACEASDHLSGLEGQCTLEVSGGNANAVGSYTATATARDVAGNVATTSVQYRVVYVFPGFQQPIDPTGVSIFRAGGIIPLRFSLAMADGTPIVPVTAPRWITPQRGGVTREPVDESAYDDPATTGSFYEHRGDSWQYNWRTPRDAGGYYWRIGVALDDGTTRYVTVGLR